MSEWIRTQVRSGRVSAEIDTITKMPGLLIVGVGNDFRGDDAAGLLVARLLRRNLQEEDLPGATILEQSGEGTALVEAWQGYDTVILVDAARSGAAPGAVHRFEVGDGPLPAVLAGRLSSHAFGVAGAVEMARALDRLPPRLVVYALEGKSFALGERLSPEVEEAARDLAGRLRREWVA